MSDTGAHPWGISKDAHCPVGASLIDSMGSRDFGYTSFKQVIPLAPGFWGIVGSS